MIKAILPPRGSDSWGSGEYGASRGGRAHRGIDYACMPGSKILALRPGAISRIGFAYSEGHGAFNDSSPYQFVEVKGLDGYTLGYWYVRPAVDVGDEIHAGQVVGIAQDISERYRGMIPHIHAEVQDPNGLHMDPKDYLMMISWQDE